MKKEDSQQNAWPPFLKPFYSFPWFLQEEEDVEEEEEKKEEDEEEEDAETHVSQDQLLGKPWNILGITVQMSYVEGRWRQN